MLGLTIDEPIERVVSRLVERGVRLTGEIIRSGSENFVEIEDQDGNAIYLWEAAAEAVPENDVASAASTKVEAARLGPQHSHSSEELHARPEPLARRTRQRQRSGADRCDGEYAT